MFYLMSVDSIIGYILYEFLSIPVSQLSYLDDTQMAYLVSISGLKMSNCFLICSFQECIFKIQTTTTTKGIFSVTTATWWYINVHLKQFFKK